MADLNDTLIRGGLRVTDDANIGGNAQASSFNGYPISESQAANTIPVRNANGYVFFNYINTNISAENGATSSSYFLYTNSNDGYIRKANAATIKTALSIPTSYLSSASVSGNTLTINPNSGSAITFTPSFTDKYHTTGSWSGLTYTASAQGGAGALAFTIPTGSTASTVCIGNDSRLSDARTPTSHASSDSTYGLGTSSNYGHVKLNDGVLTEMTSAQNGVAAGQGHTHSQYLPISAGSLKPLTGDLYLNANKLRLNGGMLSTDGSNNLVIDTTTDTIAFSTSTYDASLIFSSDKNYLLPDDAQVSGVSYLTLATREWANGKFTYQTTAPTAAISDGGIHIVYLSSEPSTKYAGYIYMIAES